LKTLRNFIPLLIGTATRSKISNSSGGRFSNERIYEVEYVSNEGGKFGEYVVAEDECDAMDLVANNFYFMYIVSCEYIRAATDEEIRIGEVYDSA